MKVVFGTMDTGGCGWHRCIVPAMELRRRGWNVDFADDRRDRRLVGADVLILQRQVSPSILEASRQWRAEDCKIVYELDDNLFYPDGNTHLQKEYAPGSPVVKTMAAFIAEADLLITSTATLAQEMRSRRDGPIAVAHNCVRDKDADAMLALEYDGAPREPGQIRIGYAGGPTHYNDFATIAKPLTEVMRRYPEVRLVLIGGAQGRATRFGIIRESYLAKLLPGDLRSRIEVIDGTVPKERAALEADFDSFAVPRYYELLHQSRIDIGIAPLARTRFNASKSWIKCVDYGLAKIPVIASFVGPYAEYYSANIEPVEHIAVAREERGWRDNLAALVEKGVVRSNLAKRNAEFINRSHRVSSRIVEWEAALALVGATREKECA